MSKKIKLALLGIVTLLTAFLIVGCSSKKNTSAQQNKVVKVGIIGSDDRVWKPIVANLKKRGITVKLVEFTDYNQPNTALANGDIDLNSFQHIYFLNNWNKAHHTNIVSIGATIIAPLAVYSKKINNFNKLKSGDTVAIPNDPTNQGRALQLLAAAGLIKLKSGVALPTPNDVSKYIKKIKIQPIDASQTARSLSDVTAAIVNNGVALDAKLDPKKAIYTEKITERSKPWVNVIAAQKKDRNNKVYQKVVKAYQTKEVANKIKKVYKGSTIPAWNYKF